MNATKIRHEDLIRDMFSRTKNITVSSLTFALWARWTSILITIVILLTYYRILELLVFETAERNMSEGMAYAIGITTGILFAALSLIIMPSKEIRKIAREFYHTRNVVLDLITTHDYTLSHDFTDNPKNAENARHSDLSNICVSALLQMTLGQIPEDNLGGQIKEKSNIRSIRARTEAIMEAHEKTEIKDRNRKERGDAFEAFIALIVLRLIPQKTPFSLFFMKLKTEFQLVSHDTTHSTLRKHILRELNILWDEEEGIAKPSEEVNTALAA